MTIKVLLDTDIGSDIDDAICLAYLLAQPQCELLGITTVSGEADKRAMLASVLCKVAGKTVPILPGAEKPLLVAQKQEQAPQAAALTMWDHDTAFPRGEAVQFMRHTIRSYPGEVVLLTIGPLTNVALLFAVDPEVPSLLKGLVMMCGVFGSSGVAPVEWNALLDPHAAAMVYRANVVVHRSIGLDVTSKVPMPAHQVRKSFRAGLLQPVLDFAESWFQRAEAIIFHDPLAAVTLFDDRVCVFERGTVQVELEREKLQGLTHWEPDAAGGRHEVALRVNPARFFEHFFSVFP